MINLIATSKKVKIVVLFLLVLYFSLCVYQYREGINSYKRARVLSLSNYCYQELQYIYGQYLGPYKDENVHGEIGYTRVFAEVYFSNMAPQTVYCSIYLNSPYEPLNKKTRVTIKYFGANYAPAGFYDSKKKVNSETKTTLEVLDDKYQILLSQDLIPKPKFSLWI